MSRPNPLLWLALVLIFLLPTAAGRLLLDLAGGLMLAFLAIPLVLAGVGWVGWRLLQPKITTCEVCGISTVSNGITCPICGAKRSETSNSNNKNNQANNTIPASSVTIDVEVKDASKEK